MTKQIQIIISLLILSAAQVISQNYVQRFWGIPFTANNVTLNNAFNGGIETPRFQMADIDGDNDLDLFVYDRDTSLYFYRNIGNASIYNFSLETKKFLNLNIKNWFYFSDINNDFKFDLFTGGDSQHVSYYRNTGTAQIPAFTLQTVTLMTNLNQPLTSEVVATPVLTDIDNDGDLDFLTGSSSGRIIFYRNIGTPTVYSFQFVTDFWAGIEIIGPADLPQQKINTDDPRHGASSIYFSDIDADNDTDLFWGDYFGKSVYFIKNTGSASNFQFTAIDTNYPPPVTWQSIGYNMPRAYDIDNDGKKDFFAGSVIGSQSKNNFGYYKNIGPTNNPQFTLQTRNLVRCVEVGANSSPEFSDIDNDGDKDLFIGSDHSTISFYRNIGTATAPSFELISDSLPIISTSFYYSPSIGDLDGDSKKDMLVGTFDQKILYFKNTGTFANPVFTQQTNSQFTGMQQLQSMAPALVDIDNDNDLDLFIGNSDGKVRYYRNDGSVSSFNFVLVSNNYQNISVGNDSKISFADLDNDNDKDLLAGNLQGKIFYYRNEGSVSNANFVLVSNNYANINVSLYCAPMWVDIDNDTDKDLFVGNIKGGLYYYENLDVNAVTPISNEIPKSFSLEQNYPNPFNPTTNFELRISNFGFVQLKIYDILGKEVAVIVNKSLSAGIYRADFNASNLPSGVYYYQLTVSGEHLTGMYKETKKMVLLK